MSFTGDFNNDFSDDFLKTQGLGTAANGALPCIRQAYDVLGVATPVGIDVPVGANSTPVAPPNAQRRAIGFANATAGPIYVRPDNAPAQVGYGIMIPSGDYVLLKSDEDDLIRYSCGWVGINPAGVGGLTVLDFA